MGLIGVDVVFAIGVVVIVAVAVVEVGVVVVVVVIVGGGVFPVDVGNGDVFVAVMADKLVLGAVFVTSVFVHAENTDKDNVNAISITPFFLVFMINQTRTKLYFPGQSVKTKSLVNIKT